MENSTAKRDVRKELIEFGNKWAEALVSNDAKRIGNFMSDDWVIVSERGTSTKERFLSFVESGALTHTAFEMAGDPRISLYGDTAVFTTRVTNTAFFNGQRFDADEFATDVFLRQGDRWKCVHSHITSVEKNFVKECEIK